MMPTSFRPAKRPVKTGFRGVRAAAKERGEGIFVLLGGSGFSHGTRDGIPCFGLFCGDQRKTKTWCFQVPGLRSGPKSRVKPV